MTIPSSRFLRAAAVVAGLALLVSLAPDASPSPADQTPAHPDAAELRSALNPNAPAIGLKYFKIDPEQTGKTYRLLVVPVRFPENPLLGGGEREGLEAALIGEGPETLEGFFDAITFGYLDLEVTLAPTVVTDHERTWYTSEGEANFGFGLDVAAYPHNSRGLVEEVTAKILASVDLRRFDNTGDGIADGLLILHSGPEAPEVITAGMSKTLMAAHSFTLDEPVRRGDAWVFPYSIASTRDPLGPWAHEVGHLFGLVDLYVPNAFCPDEGLGAWSLMATGANQDGGENPTGLDAFSLQLLGFEPVVQDNPAQVLTLGEKTFLRFFRAGESLGPEYFLVERRIAGVVPGLTDTATVIYSVDETLVDNRTCGRPLVELRGVIGSDMSGEVILDDSTSPSLRDRDGEPTNLWLWLEGNSAVPASGGAPATALVETRLRAPQPGAPGRSPTQRIELLIRNLYPLSLSAVAIEVHGPPGLNLCADAPGGSPVYYLPVGSEVRDTSWVVEACAGPNLPTISAPFEIILHSPGPSGTLRDTVVFAVNLDGLAADRLEEFASVNLAPGRDDPWAWDATDAAWSATDFGIRPDAELVSPWFTVPEDGAFILEHEWDLDAVAPDLALDAAEILLETQLASAEPLNPLLGWGHTVERGVGNALGGREALSGTGDRVHVFDLAEHARRTVRLKLRAAGDVESGGGLWSIRSATVTASTAAPKLELIAQEGGSVTVNPLGEIPPGTRVTLYGGPGPTTPSRVLDDRPFPGRYSEVIDGDPGSRHRLDLVWRFTQGGGGSHEILIDVPPAPRALLPPYPNPLRRGATQTWNLDLPEGSAPGVYHFRLVNVAGRRIAERRVRFDLPGRRAAIWDGRDFAGRLVPAGVYFLQVRGPRGREESRRLVVLP